MVTEGHVVAVFECCNSHTIAFIDITGNGHVGVKEIDVHDHHIVTLVVIRLIYIVHPCTKYDKRTAFFLAFDHRIGSETDSP
jgi:hypothetical protein